MDINQMRSELRRDEDVKYSVYQDSLGYWTIGVGHLVDARKGGKLSDAVVDMILDEDIESKMADLDKNLPWWRTVSENRQRALLNMCFNLGIGGLLGFTNTLNLIRQGHYDQAAVEMLNSKWATQVGDRAKRLSAMMKQG